MSKVIAILGLITLTCVCYYAGLFWGLGLEVKNWFWLLAACCGLVIIQLCFKAIEQED